MAQELSRNKVLPKMEKRRCRDFFIEYASSCAGLKF
jgi:hypothetical protein